MSYFSLSSLATFGYRRTQILFEGVGTKIIKI